MPPPTEYLVSRTNGIFARDAAGPIAGIVIAALVGMGILMVVFLYIR
jgi:hypothetical protein